MPRIVEWISFDQSDARRAAGAPDLGGWGGTMTERMRWPDYTADVDPGWRAHFEVLRQAILARGLRRGGDWHQRAPDSVPVFDDGALATVSYRAWGDLMAAVWSEHDRRGYGYMDFYMDSCVEDAGLTLSPCP